MCPSLSGKLTDMWKCKMCHQVLFKKLFGGPSLASSVAAIEFYHNPQILPPMWILAKCHIGSRHILTYFDISDDRLITWVARWWFLTLPLIASVTSWASYGIYLNILGNISWIDLIERLVMQASYQDDIRWYKSNAWCYKEYTSIKMIKVIQAWCKHHNGMIQGDPCASRFYCSRLGCPAHINQSDTIVIIKWW